MSRIARYWVLLLMVGCSDAEVTKLDRQLAALEVEVRVADKTIALSRPPPYRAVTYDHAEERSPFRAPKPQQLGANHDSYSRTPLKPDRIREPLEAYPLDSLRLVGTLRIDGQRSALLRDPQGHVHRLQAGDYLGMDRGRITRISKASLELVEILSNAQGGWQKRSRTISFNNADRGSFDVSHVD